MQTDLIHKTVEVASLEEPPSFDSLGSRIRLWVETWTRDDDEAKLVEAWLMGHSVACDGCSTMSMPNSEILVGVCDRATRMVEHREHRDER